MPKRNAKTKKANVYECKHFKFKYDEYEKWCFCHNHDLPFDECPCPQPEAMKFCPGFKRGKLLGKFDKDDSESEKERYAKKFEDEIKGVIADLEVEIPRKQRTLDKLRELMGKPRSGGAGKRN